MYFLTDDERKFILRRLLPQARQDEVHTDLRGWNWDSPPLTPIYDSPLALYEIAGRYCASRRDVFLRRVLGRTAPPNQAMVEGSILHRLVAEMILAAKRLIYTHGAGSLDHLGQLQEFDLSLEGERCLSPEQCQALETRMRTLREFEYYRIAARVQDVLARQPHIGADALAALALPVTVEQRLDGRFLGLSSHLSADAFSLSEPMMVDIKFDRKRDFHRLTTTGYAMVMESIYEYPVNIGCIVYAWFDKAQHLRIERDFHRIDDELRQWFIEERDELMRLVDEEIDPGMVDDCYHTCPYHDVCYPV